MRVGVPEFLNSKAVTVRELIDDALEFVAHRNDVRNYKGKAGIARETLVSRNAAEVTPKALKHWLCDYCITAATAIRYRTFIRRLSGICRP